MNIIKTKIIGDTITPVDKGYVIENQVNQYAIEFDFDETWDFEEKYCIFQDEFEKQTFKRPILNNQVIVPSELLNGRITIQVYGQNIEDNVITNRQPSLKYVFSILNSLPANASEEQDVPTPTQWELYIEQIESIVDDMCDQFQEVKTQVELNTEDIGKAQQDIENLQDRATTDEGLIQANSTEITNIKRNYSLITETGNKVELSIDSNYLMTLTLKDKNGNILSTATLDFPIESAIVNATYNNTTKEITFTLQNGNTLVVPIGDIISGLASQSDLEALANRVSTIEGDYLTSTDKTELQQSITDLDHEIELEQQAQDNSIQALQQENQRLSRIVEGLPTKNGSGTNFLLTDMVKANVKEYELLGDIETLKYNITIPSNQNIYINGTATAYGVGGDNTGVAIPIQQNTTYTIKATSSLARYRVGTTTDYSSSGGSLNNGQIKDNTSSEITINNTTDNYLIINATDLSKLNVIVDSVSPTYSQDIEVVTGNQEINVFGKNLFKCIASDINLNGLTPVVASDGSLNCSGTISSTWSNLTEMVDIFLPAGTYTFSLSKTYPFRCVIRAFHNKVQEGVETNYTNIEIASGNTSRTITLDEDVYHLRFYITGVTQDSGVNQNFKIQLEESNSATSYEKFTQQTKPISLGNIELCKIGDYQDRIYKSNDKWYLEKNIGNVVLNGTQTITQINTEKTNTTRIMYRDLIVGKSADNSVKCNYLDSILNWNEDIEGIFINNNDLVFRINKTIIGETTNSVNEWLSNHNLIVYYIKTTPTTTEITDTSLISQLEAVLDIILNINNTIITNGELPTIIDITGYVDIMSLISTQDSRSVQEETRKGGDNSIEPIEEPIETKEEER